LRTKSEHFFVPSQAASVRQPENIGGHAGNGNKLPVFGNIIPLRSVSYGDDAAAAFPGGSHLLQVEQLRQYTDRGI
jgi:hypothetical protein